RYADHRLNSHLVIVCRHALMTSLFQLRDYPTLPLIVLFLSGILLVGIISNLLNTYIDEPSKLTQDYYERFVIVLVGLVIISVVSFAIHRRTVLKMTPINKTRDVKSARHLISGIAPLRDGGANLEVLKAQIDYHAGKLQRIDLIGTFDSEEQSSSLNKTEAAYSELMAIIEEKFNGRVSVHRHTILDFLAHEEYENKARAVLKDADLSKTVVDITAGATPTAVGLLRAASKFGCEVTYTNRQRDISAKEKAQTGFKIISVLPYEPKSVEQPPT
ncbi:MAG: hypothetical protein AAFV93_08105, partial [Chloroflexota bacterium]